MSTLFTPPQPTRMTFHPWWCRGQLPVHFFQENFNVAVYWEIELQRGLFNSDSSISTIILNA